MMKSKLYLYDPKTNLTKATTYEELEGITGMNKKSLQSYKSRKAKIRCINCYLIDGTTSIEEKRELYSKEKYADECWKEIKGSDGQFMISNYGRVKRILKTKEKFLLPFQRKHKGNLFVKAKYKGIYGDVKVGHLVAHHFMREPRPGEVLIRKNGITTDDFIGNLQYVTKKELGKLTGYKSNSRPVVMIDRRTNEVVEEFRSARAAGKKCGYSYQSILDRCNNKYCYDGEPYIFKFEEDYETEVKR